MSNRYDRLLSLSSFSKEDLKTLHSKKILILGVGGVGQHIATYLVTNGIEHLTIVDYDKVEISNLNRQILLSELDVGKPKVDIVKKALSDRNREANILSINLKIDKNNADAIISNSYDVVVDALDNWKGKLIIADTCNEKHIPLLHVGVDGMSGQFCIFKEHTLRSIVPPEIEKEARDGVMGPVVGAVSSMAATYLIEFLLNKKEPDVLIASDFEQNKINSIALKKPA